eukprot:SAG31_NODE_2449_length_5669_cov_3.744345_2_plen_94_part_00
MMAEKQYLRNCFDELLQEHGANEGLENAEPPLAFRRRHPRFVSLDALYEDVRVERTAALATGGKSRLAQGLLGKCHAGNAAQQCALITLLHQS